MVEDLSVVREALHTKWHLQETEAVVGGMLGLPLRRWNSALTYSDLTLLLVPGLIGLGFTVELIPWPDAMHGPRRGQEVAFLLSQPPEPAPFYPESNPNAVPPIGAFQDPVVVEQRSLLSLNLEDAPWRSSQNLEGQGEPDRVSPCAYVLRMKRAERRGSAGVRRDAVLLRWAAFAAACPERLITAEPADKEGRALAAAFLQECAGRRHAPQATRLRRAAGLLEEAEPDAAFACLTEAALLPLALPAVVRNALLAPPSEKVGPLERQELIYLARAGTSALKVLAARRLSAERQESEVRRTLAQLPYDSCLWVRLAAR